MRKNMNMEPQDLIWLDRVYSKARSKKSMNTANTALHAFDVFCDKKLNTTRKEIMEKFQHLFRNNGDLEVYQSLDNWVQFMNKDHPEIKLTDSLGRPLLLKRKSPKTISTYLGFLVSYMRKVHAIRIVRDDMKDYVQLPRLIKETRKPIKLETIKLIIDNASPKRRALYLTLISSGMRISEVLQLRKSDIFINEDPTRIEIRANTTKTKEGRETFISNEAAEKVCQLMKNKDEDDLIFSDIDDFDKALIREEQNFQKLRVKLALTKRYDESIRYVVTLHAFRAYFHTKASQVHNSDYANAMDGHSGYLKQYYRLPDEDKIRMYKELEPQLLIESTNPRVSAAKDKQISSLILEMEKMKAQMARMQAANS